MARVSFTPNLAVHVDTTALHVEGSTVREVLEAVFVLRPRLRSYVVDDQGRLRAHVNVFVAGRLMTDRDRQSDPTGDDTEIWIFQALSGG